MSGARLQYAILALLLLFAGTYETGFVKDLVHRLFHGAEIPSAPFTIQTATRTIGSGPLQGDQILSLNGRPFSSARQWSEAVEFPGEYRLIYRVIVRRGCCWARRPTGAGGVGGPNSRSKNDGPE